LDIAHPSKITIHSENYGKKFPPYPIGSRGKTSAEFAHLQLFTTQEKQKRAWKAFFLLLDLGIVSIILPLAHFFLVPGFILASPFAAYGWPKKQIGTLISVEGTCTFCQKA
jgi:hypothetical protein